MSSLFYIIIIDERERKKGRRNRLHPRARGCGLREKVVSLPTHRIGDAGWIGSHSLDIIWGNPNNNNTNNKASSSSSRSKTTTKKKEEASRKSPKASKVAPARRPRTWCCRSRRWLPCRQSRRLQKSKVVFCGRKLAQKENKCKRPEKKP